MALDWEPFLTGQDLAEFERAMAVQKIISGGQTGVDRAALDAALARGLAVAGWCPRGRRAEDGHLVDHYPLRETPSAAYAQRTTWNVRDSDGTLILLFEGNPGGGTALTAQVARQHGRPLHVALLQDTSGLRAALRWVATHDVRTLNVAGPRESEAPGIYRAAHTFMAAFLELAAAKP